MEVKTPRTATPDEIQEESRRIRRLRIAVHLALSCIAQGGISLEEARALEDATRMAALRLFPGKGPTFDLIYAPQFERIIREVYRPV
jgi:hypothetical protein